MRSGGRFGLIMAAAVALQKTDILGEQTPPSRTEVLARYRRLRALTILHHSKAMAFLPRDVFCTKRAGWAWLMAKLSFFGTMTN